MGSWKARCFVNNKVCLIIIHNEHAIAIYVSENTVDVFDALGLTNVKNICPILQFLKKLLPCKSLLLNTEIQGTGSALCAKFCLVFLYLRCQGFAFVDAVSIFTCDTDDNDVLVATYFEKLFSE